MILNPTQIGLAILRRAGPPVGMVCGPITTGGLGSWQANMERFANYIRSASCGGSKIFNQLVFENGLWRIRKYHGRSDDRLLQEFYQPLFEFGTMKTLHFIPGWPTSYGTRWEHNQALELGLEIKYLALREVYYFMNSKVLLSVRFRRSSLVVDGHRANSETLFETPFLSSIRRDRFSGVDSGAPRKDSAL